MKITRMKMGRLKQLRRLRGLKQFGISQPGLTYVERPGAYAVIFDEQGRVAIIRVPHGHFLPGGGIDGAEQPEAALAREIREETGHAVRILAEIGEAAQYLTSGFDGRHLNKLGCFYLATLGPRLFEPTEPDHALLWLAVDEAKAVLSHEFQVWAIDEAVIHKTKSIHVRRRS